MGRHDMGGHRRHHHHDRPHRHHYDAEMLDVEDARERILSHFRVLAPADVPLLAALGLTLSDDLVATIDVPPNANSAMDGYAVRADDVAGASSTGQVVLPVSATVAAGDAPGTVAEVGAAVRIMTGAPIPEGADAVVPFEDTDETERAAAVSEETTDADAASEVGIRLAAGPGENIRPAGEDIMSGEVVLPAGTELTPSAIGVAASLGRDTVRVIRRPVVAIISTGDELIEPGQPVEAGKIYNSNAYSVATMVESYGARATVVGVARDTVESLTGLLRQAMAYADMIVTSAGVSKGDYDVVKDVLAQHGEIALWSVRMRPAKPLAFGTLNRDDGAKVPHLGLPGNPVSAAVAFEQFGRPAIRKMMGKRPVRRSTVTATLTDPIYNHDGRRVYARVSVYAAGDGTLRAAPAPNQSSGAMTSMARANGLAICPHDVASIPAGHPVRVEMLDWPDDELLSAVLDAHYDSDDATS